MSETDNYYIFVYGFVSVLLIFLLEAYIQRLLLYILESKQVKAAICDYTVL